MASKNCPHCSKQVPVACKKCGCGHVFFTARRNAASISRDNNTAGGNVGDVGGSEDQQDQDHQPTRRSGRVTRERPNFYDALEYENQTRRASKTIASSKEALDRVSFPRVLVTVGTTRFDDLVALMLHPTTLKTYKQWGAKFVSIQVGNSFVDKLGTYKRDGINFNVVKFWPNMRGAMEKADLIICHGGAGTTMEALDLGKPVIVVPNRKLMDDHQLELAAKLQEGQHVILTSISSFNDDVKNISLESFVPLPPAQPQKFAEYLNIYLRTTML